MLDTDQIEYLKACPPALRDLVLRFPLNCRVRARPGLNLGVPAPGNVGRVVAWGTASHPLRYKCASCDDWHGGDDPEEIFVKLRMASAARFVRLNSSRLSATALASRPKCLPKSGARLTSDRGLRHTPPDIAKCPGTAHTARGWQGGSAPCTSDATGRGHEAAHGNQAPTPRRLPDA
jgi:hypothetical protein